jgi:acyl-CoA dehydrogenase
MTAARNPDHKAGVNDFDRALFAHMGFAISNAVRSLVMAITFARFGGAPDVGATRRYYQHIERFSASFAFVTDLAMLTLGGYLKKKETISARLGDVLSAMYLASMVLKHHDNRDSPPEELPAVEWACRELLYQAQEQLHSVLRNLPNRPIAWLARLMIFPRGLTYFAPADRLGRRVADLVLNNTATRDYFSSLLYTADGPDNVLAALQTVLEMAPMAEAIEKKLRVEGRKTGRVSALNLADQITQARELGVLSEHEALFLAEYDRKVMDIVNVDDFESHELGITATSDPMAPVATAAATAAAAATPAATAPAAVADLEFVMPQALNQ